MLESLLFSINTVVPVFIIVAVGVLLKYKNFMDNSFFSQSEKFVFKIALPAYLFIEVATADTSVVFDSKFIIYCVAGIVLSFLILCVFVPIFIKSNDKRGAFIQGAYRSNFALLGVPLAANMLGQEGMTQIAMILPFAIVLFNMFAVIILSVYAPVNKKLKTLQIIKNILINIITNPLILAVIAALPFIFFKINLPPIINKSVAYLANLSMPLALLSLGANCTLNSFKGRFKLAFTASVLKTIIIPIVTVVIAILLGFRNEQLGIIFILFGGPTAISSYIMAKNMDGDYELAGQIMLISTIMCTGTIFLGVFLLRFLNYI